MEEVQLPDGTWAPEEVFVQPRISGYRELSRAEADLINDIKRLANLVGDKVASLRDNPDLDQRWVALGKTHLQQGFMALVRAIAKPSGF